MTSIETLTLDVADPAAARQFYATAFGLDTLLRFRSDPDGFEWETVS